LNTHKTKEILQMKNSVHLDPKTLLEEYLKENNIKIGGRGEMISNEGKSDTYIFNDFYLKYNQSVRDASIALNKNYKPQPERLFRQALDNIKEDRRNQFLEMTRKTLACTGEALSPLRSFVRAVTGQCDEVVVHVLAHWMWQIKRKARNQSTVYQIMPVLFGKQGSGKTKAVESLLAPIGSSLVINTDVKSITDKNYFKTMSEVLVGVMDELENADRTDINALKHQITATHNDYRTFYTQEIQKVPQRCSFIGTTNRSLSLQIQDSTGMRRFFEIVTLDRMDWEQLNLIDYYAIWRGIDENDAQGYFYRMQDAIEAAQQDLITDDPIDLFLEASNLSTNGRLNAQVSNKELYQYYNDFCLQHGFKALNSVNLGKNLRKRGFTPFISNGTRGWLFDSSHRLGQPVQMQKKVDYAHTLKVLPRPV